MPLSTEDRDYAIAVVRKQNKVDATAAAAVVEALGSGAEALVAAGREGQLEAVHALLAAAAPAE